MSPQMQYQLKRVALLAGLAALGVVAQNETSLGLSSQWAIVVAGVVAIAMQLIQGIVDTQRANANRIQKQDVGYKLVDTLRQANATLNEQVVNLGQRNNTLSDRNQDLAEAYADSEYKLSKFQAGEIPHPQPAAASI